MGINDGTGTTTSTSQRIKIYFGAEENVTTKLKKIETELTKVRKKFQELGEVTQLFLGYMGMEGISEFMEMANSIQEISNRLELLNTTVVNTGMGFKNLAKDAIASRTSIEEYGEMFNRIGMASGHHLSGNPNDLAKIVMTLNKQFQLMHLSTTQLMSVNTSIMNALELGYFTGNTFNSLMMHDSPNAKGYLKYMNVDPSNMQDAFRDHSLTAESYLNYILSISGEINEEFDRMPLTLGQMGTVIKDQIILSLADIVKGITFVANKVYSLFGNIGSQFPIIATYLRNFMGILIAISVVVGTIMAMGIIIKSLFGGLGKTMLAVAGASLAAAAVMTGLGVGTATQIASGSGSSELDSIKSDLSNISNNTDKISDKVGINRESLTDLITKTENLIIHQSFQNSFNLNGKYSERGVADEIVKLLRQEQAVNGVRQ